jgi:hypothetical protein
VAKRGTDNSLHATARKLFVVLGSHKRKAAPRGGLCIREGPVQAMSGRFLRLAR